MDIEGSGTEVSISVTADHDESTRTPLAPENDTNSTSRQHLPPISTSKPPAPLPVELPTPYDILPPSSSQSSFEDDLENGHSVGMREISRDQEAILVPPRRSPQTKDVTVASRPSSSPTSHSVSPENNYPTGSSVLVDSSPLAPAPQVQDLLADSDPGLDTAPIEPTSPLTSKSSDATAAEQSSAQERQTSEETQVPGTRGDGKDTVDLTVRLVGGGGIMGASDATSLLQEDAGESEPDLTDTASVTSATTPTGEVSTARKSGKKHERKKSGLAGLKKHFDGLRKKDSSSNVKETD